MPLALTKTFLLSFILSSTSLLETDGAEMRIEALLMRTTVEVGVYSVLLDSRCCGIEMLTIDFFRDDKLFCIFESNQV